jgi:predicted O-methyltransferase YrrM
MRPTEVAYWDKVAKERITEDGAINDNWLKRQAMMSFFSKYTWMKERVLEIGVGAGVSAAMLKIGCGGIWSYTGTDMSTEFCAAAHKQWRLNVVQAEANFPGCSP